MQKTVFLAVMIAGAAIPSMAFAQIAPADAQPAMQAAANAVADPAAAAADAATAAADAMNQSAANSGYSAPYYGMQLPEGLMQAQFFLPNYAAFGLAAPANGYGWSRYYTDAVLTDQWGRVYSWKSNVDWEHPISGIASPGAIDAHWLPESSRYTDEQVSTVIPGTAENCVTRTVRVRHRVRRPAAVCAAPTARPRVRHHRVRRHRVIQGS